MSARERLAYEKAGKIPAAFAIEVEERAHWEREDSTAGLDWGRAKRVRLPNLQPSTTAISLRHRVSLWSRLRSQPTSGTCPISR
jgi:CopG antitoxin of type II toxin-antitoxin system